MGQLRCPALALRWC